MWWKILTGVGALALLAILFMPIATLSVKVDLPPAVSAAPAASSAPACPPINLQLETAAGATSLTINGNPTSRQKLLLDLSKVRRCSPDEVEVILRSGGEASYKEFQAVAEELAKGGYAKITLVTDGRG